VPERHYWSGTPLYWWPYLIVPPQGLKVLAVLVKVLCPTHKGIGTIFEELSEIAITGYSNGYVIHWYYAAQRSPMLGPYAKSCILLSAQPSDFLAHALWIWCLSGVLWSSTAH
jgi:hypothetical protein